MPGKRVYTVEVVQRWLQRYRVPATSRADAEAAVKAARAEVRPDGIEYLGCNANVRVALLRQADGRTVEE